MLHPRVLIIILNYNGGEEAIIRCIQSVLSVDYPNYDIIIVDNGSVDNSLAIARNHFGCDARIEFIETGRNLGFAAGNNVGIRRAMERGADYVLLLNNDTVVEKNFLAPLVAAAYDNQDAGILSPLIYERDGKKIWFSSGRIDWWRMKSFHGREPLFEIDQSSEFITGCAMLIKAEVIRKIGLLDENFFLYWEDADYSLRAKNAGWILAVVPQSKIRHLEKSNETGEKKTYHLVLSGLIFFKKNDPHFFHFWHFIYLSFRKMKNSFDRRYKNSSVAEAVNKAYCDFTRAYE